jgi:hypothetical protein
MLNKYLQKIGVVTGALEKNSSYSHISSVRNGLLALPGFLGGEEFLIFGNALHEVFLEGRQDAYNKLDRVQQAKCDAMVDKLQKHKVVMSLMKDSIRENKVYGELYGMSMSYILDIHKPKIATGADLKTTTAKTYHDCLERAIDYGYPKQARIYRRLAKVKEFYFIFICKLAPYEVFIIDSAEFKGMDKCIDDELEFLIHFYKFYGNIIN